jgi:hypothetical protein
MLVAALALTACKSKAEREAAALKARQDSVITLRYEVDRTCTIAGFQHRADSVSRIQADCDLARRELARFMAGK